MNKPKSLYTTMSKLYRIQYDVEEPSTLSHKSHSRYYHALNYGTALEMFNETCEESLIGEEIKNVKVYRGDDIGTDLSHWEKRPSQ